jgi:hypothetical protein
MKHEETRLWARVAEVTRPLQPPDTDRRVVLDNVVRAVEDARNAGVDSAEASHVRGLALTALSNGQREALRSAVARIYRTSLFERAKLAG